MATRAHTRLERTYAGRDLGTIIADYLRDAAAGRAVDAAGMPYTPAGLRSLRRALVQVETHATGTQLATAEAIGVAGFERLGRQIVDDAGLPPSRLGSIVSALRGLSGYAAGDTWTDPRLRRGRRRLADPPRARTTEAPTGGADASIPTYAPTGGADARSPTYAMLALGAQVGAWIQRIIVISFMLTAIGLAFALL
jgi:hypothetical protein